MTSSNQPEVPIEVEAKFLGGQPEFMQILDWMKSQEGFDCVQKPAVDRIHVYFDDRFKLRDAGCRLRCVIATGQWCRYDFKAECGNVQNETLELSINRTSPVLIRSVINEMRERLPDGGPRKVLGEIQETAQIVIVMVGQHLKTIVRKGDLEVEVSWDHLTLLDRGDVLSEVEVELKHGAKEAFYRVIEGLEHELVLKRTQTSKYQRALALKRGNQKGSP